MPDRAPDLPPDRELAVITGASAGIGAVFARKLAARGYDLLLIARRQDRLRSLAAEMAESYRVKADFLVADLALDADLEQVANRIQKEPRLALLVNNAGFGTQGFLFETDVRSQMQMHRLHVLATMRLTHAALANMAPRNTGGVINVSSVAAFLPSPGSVSYNSTKAWINRFTESVAIELSIKAPQVKMQALCPGFTLSEFHDVVRVDRSAIPNRLWMSADFVVEESLRGFDRGKLFVIPGWRYKVVVTGMKLLPAPLLRRMVAIGARRMRKPLPESGAAK
jgi:short-subunit dehydrogenase